MNKWVFRHNDGIVNKREKVLEILMEKRGMKQEDLINNASPELVLNDGGLKNEDFEKATDRIKKAKSFGETVIVYSDYDCDGVCSAAILWETLHKNQVRSFPYIPSRTSEGYGISKPGIDRMKEEHEKILIITTDNGITAHEPVDYANSLGVDVIILDHHVCDKKPPKSYSAIHSLKLCAGGIAYFFSQYLNGKLGNKINDFESYLELAAIATVADMIPISGLNRKIVKLGLDRLRKTERTGLKELIKQSGLELSNIDSYSISHIIAPRINAMGRLGDAMESLRLLCTNDIQNAKRLAAKLCETNRLRQDKTMAQFSHARERIKGENENSLIFVHSNEYDEGIIGLIAGKLVEEFGKPAIAVAETGDICKASARSVKGFDIHEFIKDYKNYLTSFGGHKMAAGFTFLSAQLEYLKKTMVEAASKDIDPEFLCHVITIDMQIPYSLIDRELYDTVKLLEPFGIDNQKPVFSVSNIGILQISYVGSGRHLKIKISDVVSESDSGRSRRIITGKILDAIFFNCKEKVNFRQGDLFDIAFTIDTDSWNGKDSLILKIKDVKLSDRTKNRMSDACMERTGKKSLSLGE